MSEVPLCWLERTGTNSMVRGGEVCGHNLALTVLYVPSPNSGLASNKEEEGEGEDSLESSFQETNFDVIHPNISSTDLKKLLTCNLARPYCVPMLNDFRVGRGYRDELDGAGGEVFGRLPEVQIERPQRGPPVPAGSRHTNPQPSKPQTITPRNRCAFCMSWVRGGECRAGFSLVATIPSSKAASQRCWSNAGPPGPARQEVSSLITCHHSELRLEMQHRGVPRCLSPLWTPQGYGPTLHVQ